MKKRVFAFVLCIALIFCMLPQISLFASAESYSGDYSKDNESSIQWEFDSETGILTISGNGKVRDSSTSNSGRSPWYQYRDEIQKVVIEEGVTYIGKYNFDSCSNLTEVSLPNSLVHMGYRVFNNCTSLTSLVIPDSVERSNGDSIGNNVEHLIVNGKTLQAVGDNRFVLIQNTQNYLGINSLLYKNEDGTYTRMEFQETPGKILVEVFNSDLEVLSYKYIELDLPLFGGIYIGDDYNFIVTGQYNLDESDDVEVIRTTRYTKDWEPDGSAGLFGACTVEPFRSNTVSFAEAGDYLYVRTSHTMYESSDGLHHQSSLMYQVHIPTMTVVSNSDNADNEQDAWSVANPAFVSHCFGSKLLVDDDNLVTLDLGDGNPRALVLSKFRKPANSEDCLSDFSDYERATILNVYGRFGYNYTGVQVGNVVSSDNYYIVAAASEDQSRKLDYHQASNVFISLVPKDFDSSITPELKWITDYEWVENDNFVDVFGVSHPPKIIKISNNSFLLMWEQKENYDHVYYTFIDGNGNQTSQIYCDEAQLSNCEPIVDNGKVIWYTAIADRHPVFYWIDVNAPEEIHGKSVCRPVHNCPDEFYATKGTTINISCLYCNRKEAQTIPALEDPGYELIHEGNCTERDVYKYHFHADLCAFHDSSYDHDFTAIGDYRPDNHDFSIRQTLDSPGCETPGHVQLICSRCGATGNIEETPPIGHDWEDPQFTFSDDYLSATARRYCRHGHYSDTKEATVEKWVKKEPTCAEDGIFAYTATVEFDGETFTKTVYTPGEPRTNDHTPGEPELVGSEPPTCSSSGYNSYIIRCTVCDEIIDTQYEVVPPVPHTPADPVVENLVEPTCTEPGQYDLVTYCSVCGVQMERARVYTQPLGHDYQGIVTDPTCTEDGYTTYTCTRCGDTYVDNPTPAIGHNWGEVSFTWNGVESAIASRTCENDSEHHESVDAVITSEVTQEPTPEEDGICLYIATATFDDGTVATDEKTVPISATGYTYGDPIWEWDDDGSSATAVFIANENPDKQLRIEAEVTRTHLTDATCEAEGKDKCVASVVLNGTTYCDTIYVITPALGHDLIHHDAQDPTCTECGWNAYETCSRCDYTNYNEIPALGHDYQETVVEPTCTEGGYTVHTCSRCGDSFTDCAVDPLGHAWDDGVVTTEPTETDEGVMTYTCTRCGETKTEAIPALTHVHHYEKTVVPPTCTEQGYTIYTCSCGDTYTSDYVDPLGHNWSDWEQTNPPSCTDYGTETRTCARCGEVETRRVEPLGHSWDEGVVTVIATEVSEGEILYTCTRCGETKTNVIPKTECPSSRFIDMPSYDNWAHAGLDFCVEHGLIEGTAENKISPKVTMTRAMLVTVLWRQSGSPNEGVETRFKDVPTNKWYSKAIAWAANNGIVKGVANDRFDPNGNITREQMALILYRYSEKNDCDVSARANLSEYPDQKDISNWAKEAMSWAVASGIINGTTGPNNTVLLDPLGRATREQVAAMLMRFIQNILNTH